MYCENGKIKLPPLNSPMELLPTYLSGSTNEPKHILINIRKYNSSFNMTLFGTNRKNNQDIRQRSKFKENVNIQGKNAQLFQMSILI